MHIKRTGWKLLVPIMATVAPFLLRAQVITYVDTSLAIFNPQLIYGEINLGSCTDSLLDECLGYRSAFDIMVRPDGFLYGYGVNNFPGDTILFRDFFVSGSQIIPDVINYDHEVQGLTCDENGKIYAAGTGITQLNSECCDYEEVYLGDLPPGMQCQGDITYREGKFYVAAVGNKLVEVDMKDLSNSQVVMEFPQGTLPIHGLTTVQSGCDSVATYAIGRATDHSEIYEIDFDNWTITLICDMPGLAITGAGNQTECMLPPCGVFIDLDDDNSSFGFLGNHCVDTFCTSPVAITDNDVAILSNTGFLDSITFELVGILDLGDEFLFVNPVPNVTVTGNNTTYLTLIGGGATVNDFETALKVVAYQNLSSTASPGKRQVLVSGWANGEVSPVSIAELPLSNELMETVATTIDPTCHGSSDGSISVISQGGAEPYSYLWDIPQQGDFVEDLPSGVYQFTTIDSLGCLRLDTVLLNDPAPLTVGISYTGPPTVCDSSGQLEGIGMGGSGQLSYQWDNGVMDSVNADVGTGNHSLTVQDTNGCTAMASYQIPAGDTVLVIQNGVICEGNSIEWNGGLYSTDTLACQIFTLPNGCDSTVCLSLAVNPSPIVSISADGDFCETEEVVLSAGTHTAYHWSTNEDSPTTTVSNAGEYSITVSSANGCTSATSISLAPPISSGISFESPSCYGEDNGQIVFENTIGGMPPYQYSIDGGNLFFASHQFKDLPPGDYKAVVEDIEGCRIEIPVTLEPPSLITLDVGTDIEIGLGEEVTLIASTSLNDPVVSWHPPDYLECPDCLETTASPLTTIEYEVEVTDSNGCIAKDVLIITVSDHDGIYIPTVFSPNGDNVNDFFTIYSGGAFTEIFSFKIFDRWGNMVFSKTNLKPSIPEDGWDGTVKGEIVQSGAYAFVVEIKKVDGSVKFVRGDVVLIR